MRSVAVGVTRHPPAPGRDAQGVKSQPNLTLNYAALKRLRTDVATPPPQIKGAAAGMGLQAVGIGARPTVSNRARSLSVAAASAERSGLVQTSQAMTPRITSAFFTTGMNGSPMP